jgi:hypothetical protein
VRTRLRRHAALLSLFAAAALVAVVVASWAALRPAAGERDSLPEPIRIVEVPGSSPQPSPQSPAPALAPADPGPADVVPPPPLPDDDEDDDGDDGEDDGREGDGEDDD